MPTTTPTTVDASAAINMPAQVQAKLKAKAA
jgi:hypothetical protein